MPDKIILYGKPRCAMVPTVRLVLEQTDADYEYINILADGQAKARVREVNHVHEGVPTLEFPDGSTPTEPSTGDVKDKLRAMGHDIPTPSVAERLHALIAHPLVLYVALLVFAIGAFSGNRLLAIMGVVSLGLKSATNFLWTRAGPSS